jgi:hypothetical protein
MFLERRKYERTYSILLLFIVYKYIELSESKNKLYNVFQYPRGHKLNVFRPSANVFLATLVRVEKTKYVQVTME